MKKAILLCGLVIVLCAEPRVIEAEPHVLWRCGWDTKAFSDRYVGADSILRKEPIKYYKRWALMYCLGYTSDEYKIFLTPKCKKYKTMDNPGHIDNQVKFFGNEPLDEMRNWIDRAMKISNGYGIVNQCFNLIYNDDYNGHKIQNIVDKYLMKKDKYYERRAQ